MMELKRSKIFNNKLDYMNFATPTTKELIQFLQQFPPETPVVATWGGNRKRVGHAQVIKSYHTGNERDACTVVELDVEF